MSESSADLAQHVPSGVASARKPDAVAALCALLQAGDEADRCYACRALGVLGDSAALEPLVERLRDDDVDVCVDAAEALGRLGLEQASEALLATLQGDPDGEVKTAAVDALRRLKAPEAVSALLEVVAHRPEEMVFEDMEGWDPWWDIQLKAVQALGDLKAPDAVPALAKILDDEDSQDIESEVLSALAQVGEKGEAVLVERLGRPDPRARRRAVRALAHAGTASAVRVVGRVLKDPQPEVRAAALESLARSGARRYLGAILMLGRDPDPEVRGAALAAVAVLSQGGNEPVPVDEVAALLGDPSPVVRRSALAALRSASALDAGMLARIRDVAAASEDEVAAEACGVLGAQGDRAARTVLLATLTDVARGPETRRAAALALSETGSWDEEVSEALAGAASGQVPALRLAALTALAELARSTPVGQEDAPAPVEVILRVLRGEPSDASEEVADHDPDGSAESARSVEVAPPGAEPEQPLPPPTLPDAARGAESTLSAIAMDNAEVALGLREQSASDAQSAPAAIEAVEDDESMADYLALVRRNEEVAERLFGRGGVDAAEDARRLSAQVLGRVDAPQAGTALSAALADPSSAVQRAAAAALVSRAERGCTEGVTRVVPPQLVRLLEAEDRELRRSAAHALGVLGDARAIEPLLGRLDDPYTAVRIHAVGALGAIALRVGEPELRHVVERLFGELASPETEVRKASARALGQLSGHLPEGMARGALVDALLDAGFRGTGEQARDMARIMRRVSDEEAGAAVLARLDALETSAERRFAVEMLEEIFRPDVRTA